MNRPINNSHLEQVEGVSDKIVTHADLPTLQMMRNCTGDGAESAVLLDRLIAAAEADAPPLPKGWVVYTDGDGGERVFWHRDGVLHFGRDDLPVWSPDADELARCAPLRPTVTEADVERAAVVFMDRIPEQTYREVTRDILKAAGIEVQP